MHPVHVFDLARLDPAHRQLRVTDVNLVVHFHQQGPCDERSDLGVPVSPAVPGGRQPQSASHFSLWFGLKGQKYQVAIDVIPRVFVLRSGEPITSGVAPAIVRVASRQIPCFDHIGYVYQEFLDAGIMPYTVDDVLEHIVKTGLYEFEFSPSRKQQLGCRHWLLKFIDELEAGKFIGKAAFKHHAVVAMIQSYLPPYLTVDPETRVVTHLARPAGVSFLAEKISVGKFKNTNLGER